MIIHQTLFANRNPQYLFLTNTKGKSINLRTEIINLEIEGIVKNLGNLTLIAKLEVRVKKVVIKTYYLTIKITTVEL